MNRLGRHLYFRKGFFNCIFYFTNLIYIRSRFLFLYFGNSIINNLSALFSFSKVIHSLCLRFSFSQSLQHRLGFIFVECSQLFWRHFSLCPMQNRRICQTDTAEQSAGSYTELKVLPEFLIELLYISEGIPNYHQLRTFCKSFGCSRKSKSQ